MCSCYDICSRICYDVFTCSSPLSRNCEHLSPLHPAGRAASGCTELKRTLPSTTGYSYLIFSFTSTPDPSCGPVACPLNMEDSTPFDGIFQYSARLTVTFSKARSE